MCNPNVDELSMMTYLSQFPNAKLKAGAPLRPKTNPARVRAYGPGLSQSFSPKSQFVFNLINQSNECLSGLEPAGNSVGAPARFTVETFSAGRGELDISVVNPNGVKEQVGLWATNEICFQNSPLNPQIEITISWSLIINGFYSVKLFSTKTEISLTLVSILQQWKAHTQWPSSLPTGKFWRVPSLQMSKEWQVILPKSRPQDPGSRRLEW